MDTAITVESLSKRFGRVQAVDHLSFSVRFGEIFGLVGPDGAGKTTTMRMLAGVLSPDDGRMRVAGYDLRIEAEPAKGSISYMPQRFGLYEDLSVEENIRFYADLFGIGRGDREARSARLLKAAGMEEFRDRLAGKLSGGMKQKLGLVCALIHRPRVLLLDEPTTGVDPVSRRDFWQILYSLIASGVTIVISTAYLDEAERCSRLALLHRGRLLMCDTPENLKRRMPGAIVAIDSSKPRALHDHLERFKGVSSALLVGAGVHLVVDDADFRIPQLRGELEAAGIPFDQIAVIEPTVEDLFVSFVRTGQ
jgi:ABC-2 type transport system ATP-binding protein